MNILPVFIRQSYFSVPKDIVLISTDYLMMKIHNRGELQNIAFNHSADIDYKDFMNSKENLQANYIFLTIDSRLPADNPWRF